MPKDYNNTTDINNIITYYLRLLKSNWFLFVSSIVICSLLACLYISITPKMYERNAQIMIKGGNWQGISSLDEMTILSEINSSSSKTNINNEIELLRSPKLMTEVAKRLHLDMQYHIKHGLKNVELYSPPFRVSFLKKQEDKFSFVIIPITEKNIIIKDFKVGSISVANYKKEILLGDTISTPVGDIVILPSHSRIHKKYINQAVFVTKCNIDDLERNFAKKLTVSINKNSEIIKLSIKDYSIERADKMLSTLETVYNEEYNNRKKQVVENVSVFINDRIATIEQELGQMEKNNSSIDRYLKPQENLYLSLLQKREMNELAKTITTNYKMINEASGSNIPISPKRTKILLLAVFIGTLIPCSILVIREIFRTTIQFPKDVIDNTNIPLIGTVSTYVQPKNKKQNTVFVVENDKQYAKNEDFRIICSNIDFRKANDNINAKRIIITSMEDNSGKSFIALNLSVNLAATGKKVALLDLDFRKTTISKFIESPTIGIANYLSDMKLSIDEIAQKEQLHPNLDIFSAGILPANPAELLFDNRLSELMDNLDQLYDYILIDTTSIKVADASVISTMAEMTLFVIRENLTDKNKVTELENLYKDNRYKKMIILYNGLQNS